MRWITTGVVLTLLGSVLAAEGAGTHRITFTREEAGKLPPGWTAAKTGTGEGSVWKVVADDAAPSGTGYVLAQTAASPNRLFNLCVLGDSHYRDVEVSVHFKAVRGKNDQGGGIVWRYRDADNYYIARMNPLENNFRVYKVVGGKRMQLETKEGVKVAAGTWHALKITHQGDAIACYLDGTKYLEAMDKAFPDAGKVGLWTKSDAQTQFDEIEVRGR